MQKFIMTIGLPFSGKSKLAKKINDPLVCDTKK